MKSSNDRPIQFVREDQFSLKPYVDGLCSFIRECDTPISIAVQGDWGCGKTSMMNMIRSNLERDTNIQCIWFDTWQYSQFHQEAQMTLTFMHHFINSFEEPKEESPLLGKAKNMLKALAVGTAGQFAGEFGAGVVENMLQKEDSSDFAEEIIGLKNSFQELIAAKVQKNNGRILFFIDDLDRLLPTVAVDLLEVLKVFFDCKSCVFVLAVDTEVIFQGIKEKYGSSISDEKARCFFDKIIQLPFQLPLSHYKMEHMIEESLHVEIRTLHDREWYFKAVYLLTGGNPRSIKRLSNAFLLTDKVAENKGMYQEDADETAYRKKLLFLFSGIQLYFPKAYQHLSFLSSYGLFFVLSTVREEERTGLKEMLNRFHFPESELQTGQFWDVMEFLASTIREYTENCSDFTVFPFMRINSFLQIFNMEQPKNWIQPESDNNFCTDEAGRVLEITDPHEIYLYHIMDQVFSYHFQKADVNTGDFTAIDYHYRYSPKEPNSSAEYLFGIRFSEEEIFPTVYWNSMLLEKEYPLHEEILRLQRNLSFWYGELQTQYGTEAYGDVDFTGKEFLVYSEAQTNMLIQDILTIFCPGYAELFS